MRRRRLSGATACAISVLLIIASSASAETKCKVKPGDTLWSLAKKYHTTPKAIAKANGVSENAILALGKSLVIPGGSQPSRHAPERQAVKHTAAQTAPSSVGYAIHTKVDSACLRMGASTGARKVTVLRAGTTMKLVATQGKWAKVALDNGVCGFVHRSLLARGAGTQTAQSPKQAAPAAESDDNSSLVQTALACRGVPYARGGTSRGGFDCSGFTRYVFAKYGVSLPHSSAAQARLGSPVSRDALEAGDLVFFHTHRAGISHVGIYIGGNQFVHAATHGRGVRVDSLSSSYYAPRYRGARRVS